MYTPLIVIMYEIHVQHVLQCKLAWDRRAGKVIHDTRVWLFIDSSPLLPSLSVKLFVRYVLSQTSRERGFSFQFYIGF